MKARILYIICLMLLCISCNIEQRPQMSYMGGGGNNEYRILEVRIPENWKIVNAQLESKQIIVEYELCSIVHMVSVLICK